MMGNMDNGYLSETEQEIQESIQCLSKKINEKYNLKEMEKQVENKVINCYNDIFKNRTYGYQLLEKLRLDQITDSHCAFLITELYQGFMEKIRVFRHEGKDNFSTVFPNEYGIWEIHQHDDKLHYNINEVCARVASISDKLTFLADNIEKDHKDYKK
jgi:hypothetical protein